MKALTSSPATLLRSYSPVFLIIVHLRSDRFISLRNNKRSLRLCPEKEAVASFYGTAGSERFICGLCELMMRGCKPDLPRTKRRSVLGAEARHRNGVENRHPAASTTR
jgi:hypothetical protein